jgi:hypothetical protein
MEAARATIRNWLHSFWRRLMTKEAACWLRTHVGSHGPEQLSRNHDALVDCITRAANSSWWDWSDGSCLFFWCRPDAWRLEARDGAKRYRTGDPPPRRHFPKVPVEEPCYLVPGQVRTLLSRVWTFR